MHDCQTINEHLLDLAVNELAGPEKFALLAELQKCDDCRDEYHSMQETLRAFDRASRALAPPEIFWESYQSKLHQQLRALEVRPEIVPAGAWWRRLLTASIRVPLPAAAAATLLVALGGVWALRLAARPSPGPVVIVAPVNAGPQPLPEKVYVTKTVEVPGPTQTVERVVTRTVYVNTPQMARKDLPLKAAGRTKPVSPLSETPTLAGFQPPSRIEMRVIKGETQEK